MPSIIDTAAKRAKLAARKNPYWLGVSGGRGGLSLGYRKASRGAGRWIAKIVINGKRVEERIGTADDYQDIGSLGFVAAVAVALQWGQQQSAAVEADRRAGVAAKSRANT